MQTGDLIANRYELQRRLGEGGMATVWLARDRTLERPVAIKFLAATDVHDRAQMAEQFLREARIAASVRHRNVIQILDFGIHDDAPFMAMEALEGQSMADRFNEGAPFRLGEVIEIAARTLEGLAAVHQAGIVHRDLKPENIFLVREPTGVYPKLLDFGISKSVDKRGGRRSAVPTEPGRLVGTPEYMAPEQARGLTDLDARTDLYALGVVMYEALTGQLPYDAPHSGDVLIKVVAGGAPDVAQLVPQVGWPISDVVSKAMHRDRAQRFATAMEMRTALLAAAEPILAQKNPISLPPVRGRADRALESRLTSDDSPPPEIARAAAAVAEPRARRARAWMAAAAMLALAAFAGMAAVALLRRPPDAAAPRYIVVQGATPPRTAAADVAEPRRAEPDDARPASAPAEATAPQPAPRDTASAARRKTRLTPPRRETAGGGPAQELARAFDRQKAAVVQCLNRHPDSVQENVHMSVRLALDTGGHVQSADVMPEPIAATELGRCIASAVRAMRFGPQPEPIAIRVPLTARRSAVASTAP